MDRVAAASLLDLLTAAESIGDDQSVGRGRASSGKNFAFADGTAQLCGFLRKAERACHPATPLRRTVDVELEALEKIELRSEANNGVMVAMGLDQCLPALLRCWKPVEVLRDKIIELQHLS